MGWLALETDLRPAQVVAVGRDSVAAIVEDRGERDGARLVIVRTEALGPPQEDEPQSTSVEVALDCSARRIRLGEATGYSQHNLAGKSRLLSAGGTDWRTPQPGSEVEHVWRAVCDPAFRRPLAPHAVATAARKLDARGKRPLAAKARPPVRKAAAPPASTPSGPRLIVQAGAYPTHGQAEAARTRIAALGGALAGRPTRIESAQVGTKTVHRVLVTGFREADAARRVCATLKAAGNPCFVRADAGGSRR
jgi:hypothetical protein